MRERLLICWSWWRPQAATCPRQFIIFHPFWKMSPLALLSHSTSAWSLDSREFPENRHASQNLVCTDYSDICDQRWSWHQSQDNLGTLRNMAKLYVLSSGNNPNIQNTPWKLCLMSDRNNLRYFRTFVTKFKNLCLDLEIATMGMKTIIHNLWFKHKSW